MSKLFHYVIEYLKDYISGMIPYMIIAVPLIMVIRIISRYINKKRKIKSTLFHEIGFWIFALFLVGLASQTVMEYSINENGNFIFGFDSSHKINLIPGKIFIESINDNGNIYFDYFVLNFIGNVGIFIPIGFFVPLLWRNINIKKAVLVGFCTSLFIELTQLILPRVTDIDDLWMNTLGAVIGYLIYIVINKFAHSFFEKFKVIQIAPLTTKYPF